MLGEIRVRTVTLRSPFRVGLLAASMLVSGGVFAADFYVDQKHPLASDSNPGTEDKPWKTLYRVEKATLKPGDTVYVKPGTYDASVGGTWNEPAINLAASGTADQPITLRALPRHGAIVNPKGNNPALGSRGRHYIVIDGFVLDNNGTKGIAVFGTSESSQVKGVVIQNNIIRNVTNSHPYDNTDGIRIEDAYGTVVRNNVIHDIRNGDMSANAAGVKMYRTTNSIVENNEIYKAATGIIDKQKGLNNIFRRNYIHDCNAVGIYMKTKSGAPTRGLKVYENIIDRCSKSALVEQNGSDAVVDNIKVYNNVFANYREAAMNPAKEAAAGKVYIWNNIFYRTTAPSVGDFFTYNDPVTTVGLMDYNMYVGGTKFVLGRYKTNRSFSSLSGWSSASGFDKHSLVGDSVFINAGSGNYKLSPGSQAINAGTSTGISTGQPMNMGAYLAGNEVIGIIPALEEPASPRLLAVE